MSEKVPDGAQMVRDLQACNDLVKSLLGELSRLREPMVLWKVRDVDDGEVFDWFLAPVGWTPTGVLERFQLAYDVRIEPLGEIPRPRTDEEVLTYLKRKR